MTTPGNAPGNLPSASHLRGAVDLSSLKRPATPPPAQNGGAAAPGPRAVVDANEQSFGQLVQLSAQVPVVLALGAARSEPSRQLTAQLEALAGEYGGRFLLARVDTDASPQIAQALQLQAVPAVVALLNGQPVPMFAQLLPVEQIRSYLDELLTLAKTHGVTGTVPSSDGAPAEAPPLPPLHQEAFDAIEAGDYAAAAAAYRKALAEKPNDHEARAGLAQVELMQRLEGADAAAVRRQAAEEPDSVDAQLAVADLDVAGGHVEDAFARLVAYIARHFGEDREAARVRLIELYEVVGSSDPRVAASRQSLARALF